MASLGLKIVMPKIVIFPPSDYRFAAVFSRHTVTGETETRDKNTSGRTILLTCAGRRSQSPTVTLAVRASQWTSRLSRLATTGWLAGSTPSVCRLPPSRRHRRRVFLPPLSSLNSLSSGPALLDLFLVLEPEHRLKRRRLVVRRGGDRPCRRFSLLSIPSISDMKLCTTTTAVLEDTYQKYLSPTHSHTPLTHEGRIKRGRDIRGKRKE